MARSRRNREAPPERRAAVRLPVIGPRSAGQLEIGQQEFDVTIRDESAGGFAIEIPQVVECAMNDRLRLYINGDGYSVRVAFVDTRNVGVERIANCNLTPTTRLGLERLPDDDAKNLAAQAGRWKSFRTFKAPSQQSMAVAALAFVAGIAFVGFLLTNSLRRSKALDPLRTDRAAEARVVDVKKSLKLAPRVKLSIDAKSQPAAPARDDELDEEDAFSAERLTEHHARKQPPRTKRPRPKASADGRTAEIEPAPQPPPPSSATASSQPRPALEHIEPHLARVAHPEYLLRPEVSSHLQLTDSQRVHLERLHSERRTSQQTQPSSRPTAEQHLAHARRSLAVLSEQQKQKLHVLAAQPAPAETPTPPADAR